MQGNGLDLAALDTKKGAEEGFKLPLVHPITREPIGLWILIVGADSDTHDQNVMEVERLAQQRLRTEGRLSFTPEEKRENELQLLAADTRGWSENFVLEGEAVPFSQSNARKLYRRFVWMREQVDAGIYKRANFLPAPASSS